jgi:hypothetical protein
VNLLQQIEAFNFTAPLPVQLLVVEQRIEAPEEKDPGRTARLRLEASPMWECIKPGTSVALGVGSRGIYNLAAIVKSVVESLQAAGAKPFIVPAMGSHGGATAEGQIGVLAELGITQEKMGAEIRATMEVKEVGRLPGGPAIYQDLHSASADAVLLINRIKSHTDFHGDIESGLAKMSVIGLGKRRGAEAMHTFGMPGFRSFLSSAAQLVAANTNLIGGLAILENAFCQTAEIHALPAEEFGGQRENALLQRARALMPRLPFRDIDVLVVKEIGKNVSGTGMDTNVIGRLMIPREQEEEGGPNIASLAVLDMTAETGGNATGIGLANVTTRRVLEKIDWVSTYTNAVTSGIGGMYRVSLPITMPDDQMAIQVAVRGSGRPAEDVRMVFIRNTSSLQTLWASPNLRAEVETSDTLVQTGVVPLSFDREGRMSSPWQIRG